jgi:hypothetical protein
MNATFFRKKLRKKAVQGVTIFGLTFINCTICGIAKAIVI